MLIHTVEKSQLKKQMRIHTSEKLYSCDVCRAVFSENNNWKCTHWYTQEKTPFFSLFWQDESSTFKKIYRHGREIIFFQVCGSAFFRKFSFKKLDSDMLLRETIFCSSTDQWRLINVGSHLVSIFKGLLPSNTCNYYLLTVVHVFSYFSFALPCKDMTLGNSS